VVAWRAARCCCTVMALRGHRIGSEGDCLGKLVTRVPRVSVGFFSLALQYLTYLSGFGGGCVHIP
jgi:hypothetical protein